MATSARIICFKSKGNFAFTLCGRGKYTENKAQAGAIRSGTYRLVFIKGVRHDSKLKKMFNQFLCSTDLLCRRSDCICREKKESGDPLLPKILCGKIRPGSLM